MMFGALSDSAHCPVLPDTTDEETINTARMSAVSQRRP